MFGILLMRLSRSQSPHQRFLPTLKARPDRRFSAKKSDCCFAFRKTSERITYLRHLVSLPGSYETLPLSHSVDTFTSSIPIQCAVEITREDGGRLEASTQLATWHAAGLLHARELLDAGKSTSELPRELIQLGWIVVGHSWQPYITLQSDEHTFSCYSGLVATDLGTTNEL